MRKGGSQNFVMNRNHHWPFRPLLQLFVAWCCLGMGMGTAAAQSFKIVPTSIAFPTRAINTQSLTKSITLTNTGTTALVITSFSLSPIPAFQLVDGFAPQTVQPGAFAQYTVLFEPTAAGTINGNFTLNIQGVPTAQVIQLSGSGTTTKAVATVSPSSVTFSNVVQGTTSAAQTVNVCNTGTYSSFKVLGVNADPPFAVSGFEDTIGVKPGSCLPLQITLFGGAVNSYTGELTVSIDILPNKGVTLSGNVTAVTPLSSTSFPTLPTATLNSLYQSVLTATGGTPPYTFSVAQGSTLPSALSLSSSGTISGTSTAAVGTYSFTVQVTDSSTPANTASEQLTLSIARPTKANCNEIIFDVAKTSTPLTALTDLGTGTYLGQEGGLYPNGSNVRPSSHDADGVTFANAIQTLDSNGNPSPTGKYVLLSIGHSETREEFTQFAADASVDPSSNSNLVIVNGAMDTVTTKSWKDPTNGAWNSVFNYFLPQAGVTANQVVAVWVKSVDNRPTGTFPSDLSTLQADLESLAQTLHTLFPHLTLAYFSSRLYGGYANGLGLNNYYEPQAYESAFAIKWAVQDQINGNANLNYNPALGPVMAPWMSWGPYDWANGLLARSDGLVWTCQQLVNDGVHPSNPLGRENGANVMLEFFKTDDTTTPWFLVH